MHTGKALGVGHGLGDGGDAETRGIGAEDGIGCHDLTDLTVEIVLDL